MRPLFEKYPELKENLPWVELADLPTPVEKMKNLGEEIGLDSLYVKRDDMTSETYGGNKVRKLEFILGKARKEGYDKVLTFGCAGSNHALATTIYAKQLGMKNIAMLMPQPVARTVRKNLLRQLKMGAELYHYSNKPSLGIGAAYQLFKHRMKKKAVPMIIPPGGSYPLGTLGFVNAAFELKKQVDEGLLPEPDYLYVAMGTMGSAAGLILGLKVLGMKTEVVSVRVTPDFIANKNNCVMLIRKTNNLLTDADPEFPVIKIKRRNILINENHYGEKYGLFTRKGMEALVLMYEKENIKLEGTYTGKALAALISDAREDKLKDKTVLFWNTYNSVDFSGEIEDLDYHKLPRKFHRYFEENLQPRDFAVGD